MKSRTYFMHNMWVKNHLAVDKVFFGLKSVSKKSQKKVALNQPEQNNEQSFDRKKHKYTSFAQPVYPKLTDVVELFITSLHRTNHHHHFYIINSNQGVVKRTLWK